MTYDGLISHGEPPQYFTFRSLAALGVPHATTTRHCAGVTPSSARTGPFRADAGDVLAAAGLDATRVAYAKQMHGAGIAHPTRGGFAGEADVLATSARDLPLAIFTADCLALTLYDPETPALAMAHVGWRGTVRGATGAAVAALESVGGRAARTVATIAPSIGPCCYEVDGPVIDEFAARYPESWERWVASAGPGHWMLDLWSANEDLLARAGVSRGRIENPRVCTACNPELLFSHRKGNRGRLITVAALR